MVYKKTFEEAVSDGRLTSEELAVLNKLETDLRLPKQLAEKISLETRTDKDTGKDVTLTLPDRADIFCIILERVLRGR